MNHNRCHKNLNKCHNCVFCEAKFYTRSELNSHIFRHVKERPYTCKFCQESFCAPSDRTRHVEKYHSSIPSSTTKDFECKHCKQKFHKLGGLKSHIKRHHLQNQPQRKVCQKYPCLFCSASSKSKSDQNDHILRHIQEKPYFCRSCCNSFCSPSERNQHFSLHHRGNENVQKCDICGSKFANIGNLNYHKFKWHSSHSLLLKRQKKVYECNICSKHLRSQETYRYHMRIHSQEKPVQCQLCTYKCRSSSALSLHLKTHTMERPNKCNICGAAYSRATSLTTHIKEKHKQLYKFNCLFCSKKLFTRFDYLQHIIRHTQENAYHCKNCGKEFCQKSQLKSHLRMHERIANILCGICGEKFHQHSLMRYHRMQHFYDHGAVGWSCRICKERFSTRIKAVEHLKNAHKNDMNKFSTVKLKTMDSK